MQAPLEWISQAQGRWSATAGALKGVYERARWSTFGLSILGALAAALASQQNSEAGRRGFAICGAVLFAIGTFLTARFLGTGKAVAWVRARNASEALKRAAYLFAAQAAPYDDPATRDTLLRTDVDKIEKDTDDLLDRQVAGKGSTPADRLDPPRYLADRVTKAKAWYETAADRHHSSARRLRTVELMFAFATTVLAALVGAVSKEWLQQETGFDWVALIAVLTTVSGAILAHIEASRYDYLVVSYRAAARRLGNELAAAPAAPAAPSLAWSEFVGRCEGIIAEENGSWSARFSKP